MASIRELTVSLGFEFDQNSLDKIENGIADLKKGLLAVGAAAIGASATLFAFAKTTADAANDIARTANELGLTTQEFQKLQYLADVSGASIEDMTGGLRSLLGAMNAARLGSGTQADAFRRLGVTIKDQNGQLLPLAQVYSQLTSSISRMEAGSKRTAIASDILGGSAGKMLTILERGTGAIASAGAELESFGGIIDEAGFKKTQEFQQSLSRLMAQVKAVGMTIGVAIVPVVTKVIQAIQQWTTQNRELLKTRILFFTDMLSVFLKRLFIVARSVANVMTTLYQSVDALAKPFGGLLNVLGFVVAGFGLFVGGRLLMAIGQITQGVIGLSKAFGIMNLKALLIPMLIAAAAAAIYLIVDDIVAYVQGRPSFLGFLIKNKDKILEQVKKALSDLRKFVLDTIQKTTAAVFKFFGVPVREAESAALKIRMGFDQLFRFLTGLLDVFATQIRAAFSVVQTVVGGIAVIISDMLNKPFETLANLGPRIAEVFGNVAKEIVSGSGEVLKKIASLFGFDGAKFDGYWSGFKTSAFAVIDTVQGYLGNIFNGFADAAISAAQTVFTFVGSLIQVLVDLINEPAKALDGFKQAALNLLPKGVVSFFGQGEESTNAPSANPQPTAPREPATELPTFVPTSNVINQSSVLGGASTVNLQSTVNVTAPAGADANDLADVIRRATEDSFKKALRQSGTVVQPTINY